MICNPHKYGTNMWMMKRKLMSTVWSSPVHTFSSTLHTHSKMVNYFQLNGVKTDTKIDFLLLFYPNTHRQYSDKYVLYFMSGPHEKRINIFLCLTHSTKWKKNNTNIYFIIYVITMQWITLLWIKYLFRGFSLLIIVVASFATTMRKRLTFDIFIAWHIFEYDERASERTDKKARVSMNIHWTVPTLWII